MAKLRALASKGATIYPTAIDGLAIRGRSFAPIDALAADTKAISRGYGRDIDGVLGYSFLKDKIVLINYAAQRVRILDRAADAGAQVRLSKSSTYLFNPPVGFGPFSLPAGQGVDRIKARSPDDKRLANIGNLCSQI